MAVFQSTEPIDNLLVFRLRFAESGPMFRELVVADLFAIQEIPMLDTVADPDEHKLTDAEKKALAQLEEAQETLEKARLAYQRALFDYGYETGWDAGYDHGWASAFDAIKREESGLRAASKIDRPVPAQNVQLPLLQVPHHGRATAADLVLDYIKDNPGKRGVEIANHFESTSPPMMPERTVRTALHRLRHSQKIKIVEGRWYAADYTGVMRRGI